MGRMSLPIICRLITGATPAIEAVNPETGEIITQG
ncbi:MAG: hypothetical protein JWQ24_1498 [Tardiphaga sp.]|nr:hypothetical protein [Tardiphaga sp.]